MATRMSLLSRVLVVTWAGVVLVAVVLAGGLRVAQSAPAGDEGAKAGASRSVEVEVKVRTPIPATGETTAEELKPHVETRVIVPAVEAMTKEENKSESDSAIAKLRERVFKSSGKRAALPVLVGGWHADSLSMALKDGTRKTVSEADGPLSLGVSEKTFTLWAGDKVLTDMSYTWSPTTFALGSQNITSGRRINLNLQQVACTGSIDLTSPDGAMLGIFDLKGDRLRIVLNDAAQGRPKDISQESCGLVLNLVRYEGGPLWIVNADGSNRREFYLPPAYAHCGSPAWSPDGSKVAFDCIRRLFGENFSDTRIMVVNSVGGQPKEVCRGLMPSWSPDGKKMAFCSYEAPHRGVCIMNADGSDVQSIDTGGWGIVWSPNPDEVAYTEGGNLCLYDLKTQQRRHLLGEHKYGYISFGFTWSPDGQWICFCGETQQGREIAVVHRDGEEKGFRVILSAQTMPGLKDIGGMLAWEPKQGNRVVASLVTADNSNRQLFFLDPEGHFPPQRLAGQDPKRWLMGPAWSPDGKQIIFCDRPIRRNSP
jgi:Tol biopolymer transport system component